jgi:Kef-type K+ transport system membrane component KefB
LESNLDLGIHVLAALFVILVSTSACGALARFVGQPRVVGEIVAGVLLGPSVLGWFLPGFQQYLFPADVKGTLYVLSTIGLTFFMFLVGSGIDHEFAGRGSARRSTAVAVAGVIPAFALGVGAAWLYFDQFAAPGTERLPFLLFLGGALSITAFPVLARILHERGMTETPLGSLTLMAAAIDDAVAWGLLAIIIALAQAGDPSGALGTVLGAVLFALFMFTVGRRLLVPLVRRAERMGTVPHGAMVVILMLVMACGWFTELIGVHAVFGGFIAGMAMPRSPVLRRELQTRLMDMNGILLMPVFFVFSGLNTRLADLGGAQVLPLLAIGAVAFAGKYVGCGLTARLQGLSWRHASAIGGLMNARGLMILIFINVGLTYHIITAELFAVLVLIAVLTTAAAVPIYRLSVPGWLEDAERTGRPDRVPPATTRDAAPSLTP